jgi:hypothetical protein
MDIVDAMLSRAQRLAKEPAGVGDPEPAGGGTRGPKRRGHAVLKAVLLGGVVALAAKPEVRNRLLDALFGPEEQFEYESVTEPVASEPLTPAQKAASDGRERAAPAGEDSWYRSWDSPSGAAADVPAVAPQAPMHERWSRTGGDQASPPAAATAPADGDGEGAQASTPRYDAWSRIEDEAGATAASEESPAPDRAIWSRLDDTPAPPREPPSAAPVSSADDATGTEEDEAAPAQEPASEAAAAPPASPDGIAAAAQGPLGGEAAQESAAGAAAPESAAGAAAPESAAGAAAPESAAGAAAPESTGGEAAKESAGAEAAEGSSGAEAAEEPAGGEDEPAIGEADSHRTGWWMPRRRRTEPASDSPSTD